MGVRYKLTAEIESFIISQKESEPSLSCRALADIVNQHFPGEISKSSVNNVLKKSNLSSSVGRRPKTKKKQKRDTFQLPESRKEELSQSLSQAKNLSPQKTTKTKKALTKSQKNQQQKIHRISEIVSQISNKESIFRREKPGGEVYSYLGLLFLKAIEWEMSKNKWTEKIFDRQNNFFENKSFEPWTEAILSFIHLKLMYPDVKEVGKLFNWQFDDPENIRIDFPELDLEDLVRKDCLEYEMEECFTDIERFTLKTNSNKAAYLDAQGFSLTSKPYANGLLGAPLDRAMEFLSTDFISGLNPLIVFKTDLEGKKSLWNDFISSFCCGTKSKGFSKVEVETVDQKKLTSFKDIPVQQRFFIFGLWPQTSDYALFDGEEELEKSQKKSATADLFGQTFETESFELNFDGEEKTTILLVKYILEGEEKFSLLTNFRHSDSQQILDKFLDRWPVFGASFVELLKEEMKKDFAVEMLSMQSNVSLNSTETADELLKALSKKVKAKARKRYFKDNLSLFSKDDYFESFLKLDGWIENNLETAHVIFRVPEAYDLLDELQFLCLSLNEFKVKTPCNKTIYISVYQADKSDFSLE